MNIDCVIGVDYSSTSTGIVGLGLNNEYLYSYLIQPNKKMSFDERILYTHRILMEIIGDNKSSVKVVGIESPAIYAKGRVVDLSAGYGMLKYSIMQDGIKLNTYTPSQIKKYATGSGRAMKEDMITNVPDDILFDFKDISNKIDDLVDAYWIAKLTLEDYLSNL